MEYLKCVQCGYEGIREDDNWYELHQLADGSSYLFHSRICIRNWVDRGPLRRALKLTTAQKESAGG